MYVSPKEPAANQTEYKICMQMKIGSTRANGTTLCVFPPAPRTEDHQQYIYSDMYVKNDLNLIK
jgi:hypothetical protein